MSRCNEPIEITNNVELDNQSDSCGFNQTLEDYLTSVKRSALVGCDYGSICSSDRFTVSYRLETPTSIRYDIKDHTLGMEETIFHDYVESLDTPNELFDQFVQCQELANDRAMLGDFTQGATLSNTESTIYTALQRLNGLALISKTNTIVNVNLSLDFRLAITEPFSPDNVLLLAWDRLREQYEIPTTTESFSLLYRTIYTLKQLGFTFIEITEIGEQNSHKVKMVLPFRDDVGLVRAIEADFRYVSEQDIKLNNNLADLNTCPR